MNDGTLRPVYRTLIKILIVNYVITVLMGSQYIFHSSGINSFLSHGYLIIALLSNSAMQYLVLAALLYTLFFVVRGRNAFSIVSALVFSLFHLLCYTDISIYRIFKFHINSMVLNLVFTEGTGDSLHFGPTIFLMFGALILAVISFEFFLARWLYQTSGEKTLSRRRMAIVSLAVFSLILADKSLYAVADLYNVRSVTRFIKVFPLYQPLTIKKTMKKRFNFTVDNEDRITFNTEFSSIRYPASKLERKKLKSYPNVVWILLDAWRYDMLSKELTPNIYAFSKKSQVFGNHYSGGNCTRFGVFSLFYGIYGSYWHQFLSERQGPVLIDELKDLDYDFKIVTSANCSNPEFRKTAFVKIPESVSDRHQGQNAEVKDPKVTAVFLDWLNTRDSSKPFFSFLFYDAPHGPYSYPADFEKFMPSNKSPNYLTVGEKDAATLKNSYKNAIMFDDFQVGRVLDAIRQRGLLENTIVMISADHGEEFYESGYLGHNSAFTDEQTRVPLVMYLPDAGPGKIDYMTSHLDVVPTLMKRLGYTSDTGLYSQGEDLFDGRGHDNVVVASWDTCSVTGNDKSYTVFSLETYNAGSFEVRKRGYHIVDDDKDLMKAKKPALMAVLKGLRLFLN
ncbi:putative sulfatase (transmembrane protein) [Desulforapulum autotrophicum HRM2]|uniref:Sulfatase (Transmembrane protein) n=1 Tax=Desulforapulum autotrophicum (strain ATCC 43914 / DSM 3382 / VKM B-1955 / HRM2) TaxID=177437 RepID=C0QKJ4_DESAH|nr:sulfatase-like hydrolase/transferase [Desulforapulum autotrophicum]ACN14065.1 putative sulfatase (transmembrane protein) [Desulforapulum autotrophicum HRM2]